MAQNEDIIDVPQHAKAPSDVKRSLRTGMWVLGLGFGGFILWGVTVPLDEGVPSPATIAVETHSKQIQHPTGGVVAKVNVTEGQKVAQGDVLIELNSTDAKATYDATRIQWLSMRASEARLYAEQMGAARITFPPELLELRADPLAQQQMALQEQLFTTRRLALQSELATLGQVAQGSMATLAGLRNSIAARQRQQTLLEQELAGVRLMVADGYTARTRQNELERQAADVVAALADLRGNEARVNESLAEVRLRQEQRRQEYRKEVETQLSDARREASALNERLKSTQEAFERTVLKSPVTGSVVGLQVQTAGGVVAPGARIMEIVPDDAKLVLEAQIATHLIDRIHAGLPADIHLHAFTNLPQLVVPGRVVTVSASAISNAAAPQAPPYYLARVEVTPEGLKKLAGRELQPGMPADVVVKTGERTLLNYLLRPLLKRFAESLKEA